MTIAAVVDSATMPRLWRTWRVPRAKREVGEARRMLEEGGDGWRGEERRVEGRRVAVSGW
jgi:hypothetical protein